MLYSQRITKDDLPALRECAKELSERYGQDAVRASLDAFPGNIVTGTFDNGRLVGWQVADASGRLISSMGGVDGAMAGDAQGGGEAPVFERAIDPSVLGAQDIGEQDIDDALYRDPDEVLGAQLLASARRADAYMREHPNAGRSARATGGDGGSASGRASRNGAYAASGGTERRNGSALQGRDAGRDASSEPDGTPKKRKTVQIVLGAILIAAMLAGGAFAAYSSFQELASQGEQEEQGDGAPEPDWDSYEQMGAGELARFSVASGDDAYAIRDALLGAGAVSVARSFIDEVESRDAQALLQAGDYIVAGDENASEVVERLMNGKKAPLGVMGVNAGDILETVAQSVDAASLPFSGEDLLARARDVAYWREHIPALAQAPEGLPSIEGYIAEGEYNLRGVEDADGAIAIMSAPVQEMFAASGMGSLAFHEMLTKASLIQKEALFDDDRPLISSVIDNRLAAGAPLQIDAAVKYANNYDEARVYNSQLETDSPYNTYMYTGLPIGPICSGISQVDIEAAKNPAQTDYFYYVLEDTEGHHKFCVTAEEFEVAKQHYLEIFGYTDEQ